MRTAGRGAGGRVRQADRDAIRDWYDGYRWVGAETVYTPFDILLLFDRREFGAYWFETGTPAFLIDTLASRGVETFALDGLLGTDELLSSFNVDDMAPEALLFQTGYLTIRKVERIDGTRYYRLGYPNREVRQSLNQSLLRHLVRGASRGAEPGPRLLALLRANDFAGLEGTVPGPLRRHPPPMACEQRHRALRGLLRERVLRLPRGAGPGRASGGQHQPGASRPGRGFQRPDVSVRVHGGGASRRRSGAGAVARQALRREVSGPGRADSPDSGWSSARRRGV